MAPLFLLNGDMEIDDAADENELMAEASDMIPTCIAGIHEFWRNYRKPPSRRGRAGQEEAAGVFTEGQADRKLWTSTTELCPLPLAQGNSRW